MPMEFIYKFFTHIMYNVHTDVQNSNKYTIYYSQSQSTLAIKMNAKQEIKI